MKKIILIAFIVIILFFLLCFYIFGIKGWFVVPKNKNARQYYTTWYRESKNISKDTNIYIRFEVSESSISTGHYVNKGTDSIDVTLQILIYKTEIDVLISENYTPVFPKVKVDEFTLINVDKNDTLQVAYIRCNYKKNVYNLSEITQVFQKWAKEDSISAAKDWRWGSGFDRSYNINIRTDRQLKDTKNLLLNFQFSINDEQYKIMNCKYRVKEGYGFIFPH